jgi:hypothetical protein
MKLGYKPVIVRVMKEHIPIHPAPDDVLDTYLSCNSILKILQFLSNKNYIPRSIGDDNDVIKSIRRYLRTRSTRTVHVGHVCNKVSPPAFVISSNHPFCVVSVTRTSVVTYIVKSRSVIVNSMGNSTTLITSSLNISHSTGDQPHQMYITGYIDQHTNTIEMQCIAIERSQSPGETLANARTDFKINNWNFVNAKIGKQCGRSWREIFVESPSSFHFVKSCDDDVVSECTDDGQKYLLMDAYLALCTSRLIQQSSGYITIVLSPPYRHLKSISDAGPCIFAHTDDWQYTETQTRYGCDLPLMSASVADTPFHGAEIATTGRATEMMISGNELHHIVQGITAPVLIINPLGLNIRRLSSMKSIIYVGISTNESAQLIEDDLASMFNEFEGNRLCDTILKLPIDSSNSRVRSRQYYIMYSRPVRNYFNM